MNRPPAALLVLGAAACVGPETVQDPGVRRGQWIEAKGELHADGPVVTEVDELPRTSDDKPDKVEITAPATAADEHHVELLGRRIRRDADTTYEDADKQPRTAFTPKPGDWLRVKVRSHDGDLRARTIRQQDARDQFKVTGEVRDVDPAAGTLDVGGVPLRLQQDADVALLGGRDLSDPLALFLADDQKSVPLSLRLGDGLRLGGQLSGNYEHQDEYDLDRTNPGDREKSEAKGKLDLLWLFGAGNYALLEGSGGVATTDREGGPDTHRDLLELTRAYASVRPVDGLQIVVGRQDFTDEREWLYDEVLDGARAVVLTGDWQFEVGGAIGREAVAEANETEDKQLFVASARCWLDATWRLTAYALQVRDDSAADFEPRQFGLRSYARPRYGLGHWVDLAHARGHDGARGIDGFAVDVGAAWTFDALLRPTLAGSFAWGSGARDSERDEGFRQTGLQDNNQKLGGVTKLHYYGEVLDPELANLLVGTLALAVRPLETLSITALFHSYALDTGARTGFTNDLRAAPIGTATDFGRELDVVVGYRDQRHLTFEFVAGWFEPGYAFVEEDSARKIELTARWSF